MSDRVAHWLRPNAACRVPRRVISLDSEAVLDYDGNRQAQHFRLAVAAFDRLGPDGQQIAETAWGDFDAPADLWAWVAGCTDRSQRTVVFAHNLSYDLRLTGALEQLPELGYELRQATVSDHSCWAYFSGGDRSLYLVDSLSFLPAPLERIAGALGRRLKALPDPEAPVEAWRARCRSDVRVLREAVLWLCRAIYEHDLGDFRTTGAAQASAAFRHRFLRRHSVLVHAQPQVTALEREACWAGRAEVWRHGSLPGPLYEYDYRSAYAHIGLQELLPVRLRGRFYPPSLDLYEQLRRRFACLVEVEVETELPTLPASHEGRIVWPVGRFRTTVWDTELELARRHGAKVEVHGLACYVRARVLQEWAAWVLAGIEGEHLGATPLGRLLLKHWSRALVGRFGLRYPLLERLGELPFSDVRLYPVFDQVEGRNYSELQIGRLVYEQTERVEAPSATPFLMGAVMAHCRVRLWEAAEWAGFANVASIDTDGLIVNAAGRRGIELALAAGRLDGLRLKATWKRATLRGPRNLELDNERRIAGLPRSSSEISPGRYRGEVWESLPAALRRRRGSTVLVYERGFTVSEHDPRRIHLADGLTAPIELGPDQPQLLTS